MAPAPAGSGRRWPIVLAGGTAALAALLLLLRYGGAVVDEALPGLPYPGPLTVWGLPVARLGTQVSAVATIGLLLAAVVLSPRSDGGLSAIGYRRLRLAGWTALAWCLCTVASLCLTLSDLLGQPVSRAVSTTSLVNFATSVDLGKALAVSAALAGTVFALGRISLRPAGATVALAVAVLAVVPPVFTGHAAAASDHQLAVSSLLLHVVPVTLWAGGLLALALAGRSRSADLPVAVRRFSPLAAWCVTAVALSGLLSAGVRLAGPGDVFGTRYGQIVVLKTLLLLGLVAAGWWQRRAALPALDRGDRRTFARVALVEVLLFGAAMGAAVALGRTPTPTGDVPEEDLATALLGFPMPAELTAGRLIGQWLPDPLFITFAAAAAGLYVAGVWKLHRRGDAWPVARTAAFLAGCAVIVAATSSGLARYAPVLFSMHMTQHLLLTMVAPILLVLAGPVTLALRALPPSVDAAWPGPREWLVSVMHSRWAVAVSHPLVALPIYVFSMYVMYFTGLFDLALRSHAMHLFMVGHFLAAGYLFFWIVIGIDPTPRPRPTPPLRMLLVLISMVLHAFLGVAIMQSTTLLAPEWFTALPRPWGPSPLDDQHTAGGIAWSFGEVPALLVILALLRQWMRADEREQRRLDRAADRAEAEGVDDAHAAYNRMLAELARRSGRDPDRPA
ncbi:cytochrome c oxidase assembly protein [Polymorphospora rubra]|uniref:cytochrome c oxidase assembly protein n=1 Tax=Polymorphospora rubra TaxID=338584 RepID=UPI003F4CE49B